MGSIKRSIIFLILVVSLVSCRSNVQHRPWGYVKLGPIDDFLKSETYVPEDRLLVRRDSRGIYVMSTSCTYDLTALRRQSSSSGDIWVSEETTSRYDANGKVLSGPAVADLPYYELKIDAADMNGPKNTLYAVIGSERPADWRLAIEVDVPKN